MLSIINFFVALISYIVLDAVWLGWLAKDFYRGQLGVLMRPSVNWFTAGFTYVLLAMGVMLLVLPRAGGDVWKALAWGALFGFIVYGVYDLTNLSTLQNYSWTLAIVDILWGTLASAIVPCVLLVLKRGL